MEVIFFPAINERIICNCRYHKNERFSYVAKSENRNVRNGNDTQVSQRNTNESRNGRKIQAFVFGLLDQYFESFFSYIIEGTRSPSATCSPFKVKVTISVGNWPRKMGIKSFVLHCVTVVCLRPSKSQRGQNAKTSFLSDKKSNTRRHLTPIGDDYTKVNGRRNKSSVQSERFDGLIFTVEVVVLKSDDDVLKKQPLRHGLLTSVLPTLLILR